MVRPTHFHRDGGIRYRCYDDKCKIEAEGELPYKTVQPRSAVMMRWYLEEQNLKENEMVDRKTTINALRHEMGIDSDGGPKRSGNVITATKDDSIMVVKKDACQLQIPVQMVLDVDTMMVKLREYGPNLAPDFRLFIDRTDNGTGPFMWKCSMGGVTTESLTPYGAIAMMAKIIRREELTA